MPVKRTAEMLERIERRQAKRGVIPSLRGRDWPNRSNAKRGEFTKQIVYNRSDSPWRLKGTHYGPNYMPYYFPDFTMTVDDRLKKAQRTKKKVRWLDIGPGKAENFMPYFRTIDPKGEHVDLHTLSPEQILPKKLRPARRSPPNPSYKRWRNRLTHHVGTVETYDPKKFGGKFHVIVSRMGGTYYTRYPNETMEKVARLLHKGGTAFLNAKSGKVDLSALKRKLGQKYNITLDSTDLFTIKRKR